MYSGGGWIVKSYDTNVLTSWDHEVLLEREAVTRVTAAVDHIEARGRQHELLVVASEVQEEQHCALLGLRELHAELEDLPCFK